MLHIVSHGVSSMLYIANYILYYSDFIDAETEASKNMLSKIDYTS